MGNSLNSVVSLNLARNFNGFGIGQRTTGSKGY